MSWFRDKFKPDMFLRDIYLLDIEELKKRGIKAVLFDIDNTLVTYYDEVAPAHTIKFFNALHESGILTCRVSNNNKERVEVFAKSLGEPFYYKALKPRRKFLKRACRELNVEPQHAALAGDQLITDICGGNRMGMYTILVAPISVKEDWFVHLKRSIEKYISKDWDIC